MKILFIYPNLMRQENIRLGIAYLSACLKKAGHQMELMDYTWGGTISDCLKKIEEFKPDVVGFSSNSGEFVFCCRLAMKIKDKYEIPILFGGVHPTVVPEEVINNENIDIICVGEGEDALVELLNKMQSGNDFYSIRNLWFKREGKIIKNGPRQLMEDLDVLPFPDRELFHYGRYIEASSGSIDIMSGRGCPYICSYCINPILQNLYSDERKFVRQRRVDNVLEEIAQIKKIYSFSHIDFQDDVFALKKSWILEFSEKYGKKFRIPFTCNARLELIDKEICIALKEAGCLMLNMGIEAGNEKIREKVLKRRVSNEKIINAFKMAKNAGLKTYSFNMIGLPFETREDIQETIALNQKVKPDILQVSIFQPYPGTALQKLCIEKGWLTNKAIHFSHQMKSTLKYPHITNKEIQRFKKTFRFKVIYKHNLIKALFVLLFDLNYQTFIRIRPKIPDVIKKVMFKIVRW